MASRGALAAVPDEPLPEATTAREAKEPTPPEAMRDEHLRCHAEGHWWEMAGDTGITYGPTRRTVLGFTRHYRCVRCHERKKVTRGIDFTIQSASYIQPPGYKMDRRDKRTSTRYTALAELLNREGHKF